MSVKQMFLFRSTKSPAVEFDGQLTQENLDYCHGDSVNNFCEDKSREMSCAPGGSGFFGAELTGKVDSNKREQASTQKRCLFEISMKQMSV